MVHRETGSRRFGVAIVVAGAATLALSGCIAGPTYGTGKGSNAQLMEDISTMVSFRPNKRKEPIDYAPRPELVEPATTAVLPTPQDDITTAAADVWPESPEERLARIRAEATANQDNPNYRSGVVNDIENTGEPETVDRLGNHRPDRLSVNAPGRRTAFQRRKQEVVQGSPTQRKYLSEPPLDYRVPAETAPVGEVGDPEWRKERQAKRSARKASGKRGFRDYIPFIN